MTTSVKLKKKSSTVCGKNMSLYFQVICHRVVKRIVLNLQLSEEEWVQKTESIDLPLCAGRKRIDYLLHAREEVEHHRRTLSEVIADLEARDDLSADRIIACYRRKIQPLNWTDYMKQVIERKKTLRSASTIRNYQSTLSAFSTFLQGKHLPIASLNSELMKAFENDLLARGLSPNTISFYFRILSAVWNQAVADGLIEKQPSPFRDVRTGVEKTRKRAIDEKSIKKLNELSLTGRSDLSLARDLFLFCFYARGMTFIDLAYLTRDNIKGKKLVYTRKKTGQKLEIELLPVMLKLIRKYQSKGQHFLFPVLTNDKSTFKDYTSALRLQNKRLKKLGKMIKCHLSTYVARHSWASIAYKRGIAIEVISESMGHTSLQTTRIYIALLDNSRIDRANKVVIMGKQQCGSIYQSKVG